MCDYVVWNYHLVTLPQKLWKINGESNRGCLGQGDIGSGELEGAEDLPSGGGVDQVACPNIISRVGNCWIVENGCTD